MNARALLLVLSLLATPSLAPATSAKALSHTDLCTRLCSQQNPKGAVPAPKPSGAMSLDLPRNPGCPPCPSPCEYDLNATCPLPCPTPVCPEPRCPELRCPPAPKIPPCPALSCPEPFCQEPHCPTPVCPKPSCPTPQCPSLPTVPPCPKCPECLGLSPTVSCPQPVCPQPHCPDCPKLPPIPACPTCPSTTCPECRNETPTPPATGLGGAAGDCTKCLWKVLVNYDHFEGFGFYKAYKLTLTWHQANTTCTNDGGHLAIINSKEEADIMKYLFEKSQLAGWIFIGFHDLYQEGTYTTVLGEPLTKSGYLNWLPGQPDNWGNIEDCGSIEHRAFLNDGNCDWKVGFICEVPEKKALGLNAN